MHTATSEQDGNAAKRVRRMVAAHSDCATLCRFVEAIGLIVRSPLLLHLCGHLVCSYMLSSLLFFGRSLVLASTVADSGGRMRWFAAMHSYSAMIILTLQLFATGVLKLFAHS